MLDYLFSMVAGFWIGMSALMYAIFYWIEEIWDLPVTKTESASSAHSRLQQLVQRVIEEALHLPAFLDCSGIDRDAQGRLPEFSPSTYEDLLATAILNKVIDRYQHDLKRSAGASSSGVHSGSSSPDGAESGPGRRPSRTRPRGRDSSPEQSSLEPASHDDYAHSDSSGRATDGTAVKEVGSLHNSESSTDDEGHYTASYSNPVDGALSNINFQNKARVIFPEYGGDVVEKNGISLDSQECTEGSNHNDSNNGLNQNSDIYANNNSWEENWLFQKKRMKTAQSVPVPMLIPNSNTEYRALIGDRDAEDTTDLSEAGSETDDTPTDIKQMLVNSKTIIGGKNSEIVLALIDQDIVEKNTEMETTIEDEKSPDITVIEKILPMKNYEDVGKDENDNQRVWEGQLISLTQDPNDTFAEAPKGKTGNDMREFLKNLESDGEGDVLSVESAGVSYSGAFDYVSTPSIDETQDAFSKKNVTEATNFDVVDKKEEENLDSLNGHQQESEYIETIAKPVQRHMDSLKRQHYKPAESDKTSDNEEEPPPPLPTSKLPDPSLIKAEEEIIAIVTTPVLPLQIQTVYVIEDTDVDQNDEIVNKYIDQNDEIVNKDVDKTDEIEITNKSVDGQADIINKDIDKTGEITNKSFDGKEDIINNDIDKTDEILNRIVHKKGEIINIDVDQNVVKIVDRDDNQIDEIINKDVDKNDKITNKNVDGKEDIINKDIDKTDEIIEKSVDGKEDISNKDIDKNDEIVNIIVHEKDEIINIDVDQYVVKIVNKDDNQNDEITYKDVDKNDEIVNKDFDKVDEVVSKDMDNINEFLNKDIDNIYKTVNKDVDQNEVIVNKDDDQNHEIFNKEIDQMGEFLNEDVDENDEIQFIMNGKPYISDPVEKHDKDETQNNFNRDYTEKDTPPGSIADREHKKWLNAVPMENNPYSPEAIERRLSKQSNSSLYDMVSKTNHDSKQPEKKTIGVPLQVALSEGGSDNVVRYGRDYYINASKKATGARKRLLDMKFDSMPDEAFNADTDARPKTMIRSTSEAATPSWIYTQGNQINEDPAVPNESSKIITTEVVESPLEIYAATPVIVEDVDSQFDELYEKAFKYENDTHEFYALPVEINAESTQKLLELTNGIIVNNDLLDQSDSISSQDDSPRVYNIKSGKIVSSTKDKHHNQSDDETPNAKMNGNSDNKDNHLMPGLTSNSKSWKSMGDVYSPAQRYAEREDSDSVRIPESKIEEDIDLPSVKDLRKKFFINKTENPPIYKPKRKISKDLLDNKIMTKSFSHSQTNLKQPQHMHSITARSVSKEFREELKLSMPEPPIKHPGGAKNLPNGSEDPAKEGKSYTQPGSPVPEPGSLRNKLAFFEQLNKH